MTEHIFEPADDEEFDGEPMHHLGQLEALEAGWPLCSGCGRIRVCPPMTQCSECLGMIQDPVTTGRSDMTTKGEDFEQLQELEEDESSTIDEPAPAHTFENRKIFTDKSDPPVGSLHAAWKAGDLVLDPIFQRRPVWDDGRSGRLVESVILEVPLPVFYFAESQDGTREVIDGQQRLRALFRFLDNQYALSSLKALSTLNGKYFRHLDRSTQRLVRDCAIRVVLFKKESDESLRFEIFERLNTGAVPLNEQELRNCVYRGPYNDLLIELSRHPDYMRLMGFKGPEKRFRDVEYVLRFAAFHHATYLNYRPSMARFLSEDMANHQHLPPNKRSALEAAFKTSVTLVNSLLGKNAFKRYYRGDEKSPGGYWEPKKFNASLYDILMGCFANADKNLVMAKLDAIREALMVLMTEDKEFIDAIELSTSSVQAVRKRFDKWRLTLDAILATSSKQPRCFSRILKEELYQSNSTCKLCHQHIANIDDAAVDHIIMYWLGGETIPPNARLTHRYCNWARPKTESEAAGDETDQPVAQKEAVDQNQHDVKQEAASQEKFFQIRWSKFLQSDIEACVEVFRIIEDAGIPGLRRESLASGRPSLVFEDTRWGTVKVLWAASMQPSVRDCSERNGGTCQQE
jgi:Protein of unknown function DUF262